MKENRLSQIVEFCKLIDKEKFVQRRTYLSDGERLENDAEHAWHMAVMAILLSDYSNEKVDGWKAGTGPKGCQSMPRTKIQISNKYLTI